MALSFEKFMELSGADLVAGNIIVGIMADRKKSALWVTTVCSI